MHQDNLTDLLAGRQGLTKSELIQYLARRTGLTKVETETIVDGMLGTIRDALTMGKKVELRGFGTFMVRTRQPREARNPATQETVLLDRRTVPVFKPSKSLKTAVDESADNAGS